jgi:septum formation protein
MGSPERRADRRPAPTFRLVLASTSPQRTAILDQLGIPHEIVPPAYEEQPDGDPLAQAVGKARSIAVGDWPVLGVDTVVLAGGRAFGKPADRREAEAMLSLLAGSTHEVVSGLCLRTAAWEEHHREVTRVCFRPLAQAERQRYLDSGEWEGRAGAYAIQGRGAALVRRVEGDYLNVVGLPAAALVAILARRFPGSSGFGECTRFDG